MKNLQIKSVDVMKLVKDNINGQPTDAQIQQVITSLVKVMKPTHIALAIPMDTDAQFRAVGSIPQPRTLAVLTQKWADTIHQAGCGILWRGTFAGIEGIWNFPNAAWGTQYYIPTGTAASAQTDGETTWIGKIYRYISQNPTFFANGDIWAPIPEVTGQIFNNATNWVNPTNENVVLFQFMADINTVSKNYFASVGKSGIICGASANNFSEINSGYIPQSYFDAVRTIATDHYGVTHTPQEMDANLTSAFNAKGQYPIFHQEWSDYWNGSMSIEDRLAYLKTMYDMWTTQQAEGQLYAFSYWGAWAQGTVEEIMYLDLNGVFRINGRGKFLGAYFNQNKGPGRLPVVDSQGNY